MKIEKNLGTADRIVRMVFSVITIALILLEVIGGPWAAALLALSIVLLITALAGFCPVYRIFGLNDRKGSTPGRFYEEENRISE